LQATITLEYKNEKTAQAVAEAVSPDNFKAPVDLQIQTDQENNKVVTQIECEGKLSTLISTIDDLLFSASIAEKTIQSVGNSK
jgi:hypothetical protein